MDNSHTTKRKLITEWLTSGSGDAGLDNSNAFTRIERHIAHNTGDQRPLANMSDEDKLLVLAKMERVHGETYILDLTKLCAPLVQYVLYIAPAGIGLCPVKAQFRQNFKVASADEQEIAR